jgi:NAD(P)-dependent dehydrogenase (short-subunit alcohol dehydrogenase family)
MPPNRASESHAGQVALVTGPAVASAKQLPRVFAERGTRIVLGDIDYVSEASDLIDATGHPAVPVTPHVSDRPSTEGARDRVTDALRRVDIGAIKRKYDPQNLFHHNANIQPA